MISVGSAQVEVFSARSVAAVTWGLGNKLCLGVLEGPESCLRKAA